MPSRRHTAALVLAVAACCSLLYQFVSAPDADVSRDVVSPRAAQAEFQGDRGPPAATLRAFPSVRRAKGPPPRAATVPTMVETPLPDTSTLQGSSGHDAVLAEFIAEERDTASSDALTRHFTDALNDLDVAGSIDELSCGRTLCKMNLHFASLPDALRFQQEAGMPERRTSIDVQLVDEQIEVEVLLAKE
jgi:hypothetical protein